MSHDDITREQVARIVHEARKLIRAHEARSPSSQHITLGESQALFDLNWEIRQTRTERVT